MVEESHSNLSFKGLYPPARKLLLIFALTFVALSLFIIIECAFVLTDTVKFSHPALITLSYLFAIFLIVLGMFGLRYIYISSTFANSFNESIVVERPATAPIWISHNRPFRGHNLLLPGAVHETPPPRYSSLGDIIENSAGQRRNVSEEPKP